MPRLSPHFSLLSLTVASCVLAACTTTDSVSHNTSPTPPATQDLPVNCSALPPVHDIWQLEDMLLRNGTLTADMNRDQRESAIRQYIAARNATHLEQCKGQLKK